MYYLVFLILKKIIPCFQVISSYNIQQYSAKQYSTAPRQSPQRSPSSYPSQFYSPDYKAYFSQNYPSNYYQSYAKASEPIPVPVQRQEIVRQSPVIESKLATPSPVSKLETLKKCSGKIDSQVLNNLAIALQLLIVNNIINNPPETLDFTPISETIMQIAFPSGKYANSFEAVQVPNSKFLGSSSFGQDIISPSMLGSYGFTSPPSPRAGLNLMSPYDAIAKSTPMSESLLSSFVAKNDFQSPYAAIMAADNNKDLFSISELFS